MKAVAYFQAGSLDVAGLKDIDMPSPVPGARDLLVEVQAVSVNPVDTKVRRNAAPAAGQFSVLGYDAVGVVREVGANVTMFKPGDEVWYAGAIDRPGCNSQYHLVDERIVSLKPVSLSAGDAAALPLTGITAWELLFDRLQISRLPQAKNNPSASLLIVGAAGGVGSILIQLARALTSMTVIATASRLETKAWVMGLGAHVVIDHHQPMALQIAAQNLPPVTHVVSLTHTDQHLAQLVDVLTPQGKLALIDDPETLDVKLLKRKSLSLHWELMFTRSLYQTDDMIAQHTLLQALANLVDEGVICTTARQHLGKINAANITQAHRLLESGATIGKVVLEGF